MSINEIEQIFSHIKMTGMTAALEMTKVKSEKRRKKLPKVQPTPRRGIEPKP